MAGWCTGQRPRGLRRAPAVTFQIQQHIRFGRAPRAGGVERYRNIFGDEPRKDWVDDLPCRGHFIATDEQRGVAHHGVEEETLIAIEVFLGKLVGVVKVHMSGANTKRLTPAR